MLLAWHLPTKVIQAGILELVDVEVIQHIRHRLKTFRRSCLTADLAIGNCKEGRAHRHCEDEQTVRKTARKYTISEISRRFTPPKR